MTTKGRRRPFFFLVRLLVEASQEVDQVCCSVHGRFVGTVVAKVVVIDRDIGLEVGVFIGFIEFKTDELFVDMPGNGAINQRAVQGIVVEDSKR